MEKVKKEYVEQSSPQKLNEILINATNNFFQKVESGILLVLKDQKSVLEVICLVI